MIHGESLAGEQVPLKRFEGQVLLIVKTASALRVRRAIQGPEQLHRSRRRAALRCSLSRQPIRRGKAAGDAKADREVGETK